MLTHLVLFWTDKPQQANRDQLLQGARELAQIPGVLEFRCGKAVESPRASVDDSFAVGISMSFQDQAAADAYQTHPIHQAFIEKYVKNLSKRLVVYDFA